MLLAALAALVMPLQPRSEIEEGISSVEIASGERAAEGAYPEPLFISFGDTL